MTDPTAMTLAEVYALVADLDVISLDYSCPPLGAHWWVNLRTCADLKTAAERVRDLGIRHRVDDERATVGHHFRGVLRVTVWGGPGVGWGIVHVHHPETPCESEVQPEQSALFGGASA